MNLQLLLHNTDVILRNLKQNTIENFTVMGELPDGRRLHLFYDEDANVFHLSLSTETEHEAIQEIVSPLDDR